MKILAAGNRYFRRRCTALVAHRIEMVVSTGGNRSKSRGNMPTPVSQVRVEPVQRPLTLQDLPQSEKDKVARALERLAQVVKDNSDLQAENTRLDGELQIAINATKSHLEKLGHLEELQMTQQTGRATAIGMLHLYQAKLAQLAGDAKASAGECTELRARCASLEGDIKRLEALVESQRVSLGRGEDNGDVVDGLKEMLDTCRADLQTVRGELQARIAGCAALERDKSEGLRRISDLERQLREATVALQNQQTLGEAQFMASNSDAGATAAENEKNEPDAVSSSEDIISKDDTLNRSLLNHSLEMANTPPVPTSGSGMNISSSGSGSKRMESLLASLSPKGAPQRRNVSTSPLPREILAANIAILRESLQSGDWSDAPPGSVGVLSNSLRGSRLSDRSSADMGGGGGSGRRAKAGSPNPNPNRSPTRPGRGPYGQTLSPPRIRPIATSSTLLSETASSSARTMEAAMPWSAVGESTGKLVVAEDATRENRKKTKALVKRAKLRKEKKKKEATEALVLAAERRESRVAARRRAHDEQQHRHPKGVSASERKPVVSRGATSTMRNSSESLLAMPSSHRLPPTLALSPARSQASHASRSTFSSSARNHPSATAGRGETLHHISRDSLYDISLFNLVEDLG